MSRFALARLDPPAQAVFEMKTTLRRLCLVSLVALLTSCGARDAIQLPSVIPSGLARGFAEDQEQVKHLRRWVPDTFPAGTTMLDYRRADAWDGTIAEFWILNCVGGFSSLTQTTAMRTSIQVPTDSGYKDLAVDLRRLGITLGGKCPPAVGTSSGRPQPRTRTCEA